MSSLQGRGGNKSSFSWQMLRHSQHTQVAFRSSFKTGTLDYSLEVCKNHQEISISNWLVRGSALGQIGGLSARQFNSCLPRTEDKRRRRQNEGQLFRFSYYCYLYWNITGRIQWIDESKSEMLNKPNCLRPRSWPNLKRPNRTLNFTVY